MNAEVDCFDARHATLVRSDAVRDLLTLTIGDSVTDRLTVDLSHGLVQQLVDRAYRLGIVPEALSLVRVVGGVE